MFWRSAAILQSLEGPPKPSCTGLLQLILEGFDEAREAV